MLTQRPTVSDQIMSLLNSVMLPEPTQTKIVYKCLSFS